MTIDVHQPLFLRTEVTISFYNLLHNVYEVYYICYKCFFMETADIRQKLHQFIDMMEDKKAEAIYTLFESQIEDESFEYTDEFKAELDRRYEHYENGGEMVSAEEAKKQIKELLQPSVKV